MDEDTQFLLDFYHRNDVEVGVITEKGKPVTILLSDGAEFITSLLRTAVDVVQALEDRYPHADPLEFMAELRRALSSDERLLPLHVLIERATERN